MKAYCTQNTDRECRPEDCCLNQAPMFSGQGGGNAIAGKGGGGVPRGECIIYDFYNTDEDLIK
jgi:hypothetical protein